MRKPMLVLVAVAVLSAGDCLATKLTDAWKAPDAPPKFNFSKILVACVTGDDAMRRTAEDYLVLRIGPDKTIPSYKVVPESEAKDVEKTKARVKEAGFDGAVVMRVVSVDQEETYNPGSAYTGGINVSYYGSFWGYWGYGWPAVYSPGYLTTDKIVRVETLVYSVTNDKILWGARTKTTNPKSVLTMVDEIADAVAKRLKRDKLID